MVVSLVVAVRKNEKYFDNVLTFAAQVINTDSAPPNNDTNQRGNKMTKPVLFTHSYAAGKGAVMNPAAAYIKGARVFQGKGFCETHTDENGDRFVFSFWLSVRADQIVAVQPSDEMIAAWKESHGGLLTALMPEGLRHGGTVASFKASMRELSSASGFSWQAIAGLVDVDDLRDHLIGLLGDEHRAAIVEHFHAHTNR